jgi:hypothetical protein
MEKIIRFKRNWEESFIRVNICEGAVAEIDTPLAMFEKRFKELLDIPQVRWKLKKNGDKLVKNAVMEAFEATINEMKEETRRV